MTSPGSALPSPSVSVASDVVIDAATDGAAVPAARAPKPGDTARASRTMEPSRIERAVAHTDVPGRTTRASTDTPSTAARLTAPTRSDGINETPQRERGRAGGGVASAHSFDNPTDCPKSPLIYQIR